MTLNELAEKHTKEKALRLTDKVEQRRYVEDVKTARDLGITLEELQNNKKDTLK